MAMCTAGMATTTDDRASAIAAPARVRETWTMLLALTAGFAMSQAYRTVAAIMATPLQAEFNLSAQALGVFAGAFHFSFGALQLFMGMGIDLLGVRRTVLGAFPLAIAGSVVAALAPDFSWLLLGQVLIGIGCAPAFLACTVFIARNFASARYAAVSGVIMGIGSSGTLATGTPLAWLIESSSWRMGFWVLAGGSALAWGLIWCLVREPAPRPADAAAPRETLAEALRRFGALFLLPHTLGIVLMAGVSYAAFISLRGLWLGPLMIQRHHFSLVQTGNVMLIVSLVSLLGPPLFGRFDPGPQRRRRWISLCSLLSAGLYAVVAMLHDSRLAIATVLVIALLSGYMILQYADVRGAYPAAMTGRALSLFTMAMFMGIALMQWLTGLIASWATAFGHDPFNAVLLAIPLLLVAAVAAFAWLPKPPQGPA